MLADSAVDDVIHAGSSFGAREAMSLAEVGKLARFVADAL
jgi:hypothetical protein